MISGGYLATQAMPSWQLAFAGANSDVVGPLGQAEPSRTSDVPTQNSALQLPESPWQIDPELEFVRESSSWDFRKMGLNRGEIFHLLTGQGNRLTNGKSGAIYFRNDHIEAIGISVKGGITDQPNEDSIGQVGRSFHLADGMGGMDDGEIASTIVIDCAMRYVGDHGWPISSSSLPSAIHYELASVAAGKRMGSTYAGIMLGGLELGNVSAHVGDSSVLAVDGGEISFMSGAHFVGYSFLQGLNFKELKPIIKAISPEAYAFLNSLKWKFDLPAIPSSIPWKKPTREDKKDFYARLLYERLAADRWLERSFSTRHEAPVFDVNMMRELTASEGSFYAIYSDGVSKFRSPFDVRDAFRDTSVPLYRLAEKFTYDVIDAQLHGAKISMGFGKPIPVEGKKDNISFWVVRNIGH